MSTALVPSARPEIAAPSFSISDVSYMAEVILRGGMYGHKSVEQVLTLMLMAQAKGLHPVAAMERYHVVQGRPIMKADAILAEFQAHGGRIQWGERTDVKASATFSHPSGGELPVEWTIERAKKAGLTGKDIWAKHPAQMLSARVISEGVRAILPGVCMGIYTEEEVLDMEPMPPPRNVTPSHPSQPQSPPQPPPRAIPAKPVATTQAFNNVAPAHAKTPAPPPDWDPRAEFVKLAIEKGFDVLNAEGVPSGAKCREVLYTIYGTTTVEMPTTKDLWDAARKTLEVYQAPATGPAMGNTPDGEDDLEDPFKD